MINYTNEFEVIKDYLPGCEYIRTSMESGHVKMKTLHEHNE